MGGWGHWGKDSAGTVQVAEEVNSAALVDFFIERLLGAPPATVSK